MSLPGAIVIDTETTGFGGNDRIIEIAAVTLAPGTWEVADEYDTLVNPERDVGAVGVHGISPSMVQMAPVFSEIVADVARRMENMVVIAHNARFDTRMLEQEFRRLEIEMDSGDALCTLKETRQKLCLACESHGIELANAHRALADARATAELARKLWLGQTLPSCKGMWFGYIPHAPSQRTMRRGIADEGTSTMHRIVSKAPYPHADEAICCYLDTLDWYLDDAVLDKQERSDLDLLARQMGISAKRQQEAHRQYFESIVESAKRDGVVTESENKLIRQIAGQLGIGHGEVPEVTEASAPASLEKGMRVCFTGVAADGDKTFEREQLMDMARQAGLEPVQSVTKTKCDLLVAQDPSSMSGKAKNAKKFGVPIMSTADFLAHLDNI